MNSETIKEAMGALDEETLLSEVKAAADENRAEEALNACREGMERVGALFEEGDYFVGDLIFAGEIMNEAIEILKPVLTKMNGETAGRVILCTVKEDRHDIGKNIVKAMMEAAGLEVVDLGTDTAPETVVEAAKKNGIRIIALSCVLTLGLESMKRTVEAFQKAGMRDSVRIIVGGAPVNERARENIGADAWTLSPQKSAEICRNWANELKGV